MFLFFEGEDGKVQNVRQLAELAGLGDTISWWYDREKP